MFATFGNIQFALLTAPTSFTLKKETEFAEHARVNNKPRLQRTGEKLDELSIQLQFHKAFCVPETEVTKFESLRKSAQVNSFVLGSGELVGTFVIASITKTVNDTFDDGTLLCVTLDVLFKESVSSTTLTDMALGAVASAFAVNPNTPLPIAPSTSIADNPAAQIAEYVNTANVASKSAATAIAKAITKPNLLERASTLVAKATQDVTDALNKVDTVMNATQQFQAMATNLQTAVATARTNSDALHNLTPITNINDAKNASDVLQENMKTVNSASAPIALVQSYRGIF